MISQPNVSAGTAPARFEELAAEEASRTFAGREKELAQLSEMLGPAGPAIVYLHGIPGIGKSRLISAFADHARHENATIIVMDCRSVEPTEQGFLHALGLRFGKNLNSLDETMAVLGGAGRRVVLALDHFEVLRLLDSWLRRTFIPQLPATVRLVLADREAPSPAWAAQPGWQRLFRSVELDGLSSGDATLLLARLGIPESRVTRINRLAQGHPLALTLAASSLANRQDPELEDLAIHRVISELTQLYLAEIADPVTRRMLETASVLRRVTVSLLRAIIPDIPPQDAFARLKTLPFVHIALDGLHIHDAVKQVVATALRAADPAMYREYRRAAWLQLRAELATAAPVDHWRYTADMLYLLENPGIRDAFFSSGAPAFGVEPARAADGPAIRDITDRHEGKQALHAVCEWWTAAPETFFVIRDREGKTVGFYCLCDSGRVPA
jgi:AAA ATPase-like protein